MSIQRLRKIDPRLDEIEVIRTEGTNIDGEKSKRYVQDLQAKLNRAAQAFSGQLREVRTDDIDKWIKRMEDAGKRPRNNYRMALVTLFSYARDKGYRPRGQQTEAEFVTRFDDKKGGKIGIYTPQQFATLLRCVDERFVSFVALGGFAGLRSIEILRLEWVDVWFEKDRGWPGQIQADHPPFGANLPGSESMAETSRQGE